MKQRDFRYWPRAVAAAVFFLFASVPAFATTYTYTSPNYTAASIVSNGAPVYTTAMNVTASFTTASPLPPNLSSVNIGPSGSNLIQNWTIFDGLHTYTPSNTTILSNSILASTDASGNITSFGLDVFSPPLPYVVGQKFSGVAIAFPSFVEAESNATCTAVDGAGACTNVPSNTIGSEAGVGGGGTFTTSAPVAPTFTAAPNPAQQGQTVVLTANTGSSTATGTVTFSEGATVLCNAVAIINGVATCNTTTLGVGTHTITATFAITISNITSPPPFSLTASVTITAIPPPPPPQAAVPAPMLSLWGALALVLAFAGLAIRRRRMH